MEVSGDVGGGDVVNMELEQFNPEIGQLLHRQPDVPGGGVDDVRHAELLDVLHILYRLPVSQDEAGDDLVTVHSDLQSLRERKMLTPARQRSVDITANCQDIVTDLACCFLVKSSNQQCCTQSSKQKQNNINAIDFGDFG